MVAPSASAVALTDPKSADRGFPVFHRVVAHDGFQAPALVRYATKGVTSPKIYLVDDQTTYGAGLIKYALPPAKKIGVAGTDSVPRGTADWTSVAAKVKAAGANVVIYGGYTTEAAKFFKALRDGGYTGILAAGDGVNTSDFPDLAGKAAEGVRLTAADVPFDATFLLRMNSHHLQRSPELRSQDFTQQLLTTPHAYSLPVSNRASSHVQQSRSA